MNTKIVYVAVSSPDDYYLEQSLLSVYSLKHHNPNSYVILVVDEDTKVTISGKRSEILKYVDQLISVSVDSKYSMKQKSRYIKTSLREHLKGDYLFIDSDTIVTTKIDEIDNWNIEIGAVADKHVPFKQHPAQHHIKLASEIAGFEIDENFVYFNSGVFFVKDSPLAHSFYKEWNCQWQKTLSLGMDADQPALAATNQKFDFAITEIGGIWNCQLTDNGLKYFSQSKIIHYFASTAKKSIISPYRYYQDSIYSDIKKTGLIPEYIKALIENPLTGFEDVCRIVAKNDIFFLDSDLHKFYLNHAKTFVLLDQLTKIINKLWK